MGATATETERGVRSFVRTLEVGWRSLVVSTRTAETEKEAKGKRIERGELEPKSYKAAVHTPSSAAAAMQGLTRPTRYQAGEQAGKQAGMQVGRQACESRHGHAPPSSRRHTVFSTTQHQLHSQGKIRNEDRFAWTLAYLAPWIQRGWINPFRAAADDARNTRNINTWG
jgi:hypothetical protein